MTTATENISVLLVDDHPLVLEGLRACFSGNDHITVVGTVTNGEEAVRVAHTMNPDVIVMDITLPLMNGLTATRRLLAALPNAKILILTMHDNSEYVIEAMHAGARGYVLKDASPQDLIRAIESVHRGEKVFSPALSEAAMRPIVRPARGELSRRELQVLALIADGFSNKETAQKLGVSVRTVETHREHIMKKLNIHSVAGLTKYALSKGIVK